MTLRVELEDLSSVERRRREVFESVDSDHIRSSSGNRVTVVVRMKTLFALHFEQVFVICSVDSIKMSFPTIA